MIKGAPYAPLSINRIKTMFKLLEIKKGGRLADLGSGDGRIVIFGASSGLKSFGFEFNPLLYKISVSKIKKNKIKNATIILGDYWKKDLSKFDYITIYGTFHIMNGLEKKLIKELKPGAKVVSNHFQFPNWEAEKKQNDVYLYIKK